MGKQKIMLKREMRLALLLLLLLIMLSYIVPLASSENDPGHDTLYIEQQGDSVLNGTINISQQLKVANRLYSSYLEILGNGSQPTGSFPQIYASDANTLTINSLTSLHLLKDAGSTVYIGGTGVNLNISGALYLGSNNRLYTSAAPDASNLNLYWGDKLLCNTSASNCGWVSTTTGGGDIQSVQTDNTYIYNGSDTGDVYLRFNESKLNATIDAKTSGTSDGNNYTTSIVITGTATKNITLTRQGMINISATFTDIDTDTNTGNCSVDQSCPNVLYDSNATYFINTSTGARYINVSTGLTYQTGTEIGNCSADGSCSLITYDSETTNWDKTASDDLTTSSTWTGGDLSGTGLAPQVTDSSHAHNCVNITGATSNLCAITDTNTWWSISGSLYLWNNSNVLAINETKLNATIEARATILTYSTGGWTNNSQNTSTTLNVGIGDTTPDAPLDVQSNTVSTQLRVSYDDNNYGNISVNSGGNMTIKATGHVIIDLS